MSFRDNEEDSLLPLVPQQVVSTRAITPSKLVTNSISPALNLSSKKISRNSTPTHINKLQSNNIAISHITNDESIINRAPSRSTSRRKQSTYLMHKLTI